MDDPAKRLTAVERSQTHANIRPKDAATLLILDRAGAGPMRVLMGRRHMRHGFYPGAYVFPGGRVDPGDSRVALADDYQPAVMAKVSHAMKGSKTAARARALGVAALRETYEEAGLLIGIPEPAGAKPALTGEFAAFSAHGVAPALGALRLVARAITPPRRPRRFDTRFFAVFADAIAGRTIDGLGPSGELEDVAWLSFAEARAIDLPPITQTILDELAARLTADPELRPDGPAPFYFWRGSGFRRELI